MSSSNGTLTIMNNVFHPPVALFNESSRTHTKSFTNNIMGDPYYNFGEDVEIDEIVRVLRDPIYNIIAIGPYVKTKKGNITIAFYSGNYVYKVGRKIPPVTVLEINNIQLAQNLLRPRNNNDHDTPEYADDCFYYFNGISIEILIIALTRLINNQYVPSTETQVRNFMGQIRDHGLSNVTIDMVMNELERIASNQINPRPEMHIRELLREKTHGSVMNELNKYLLGEDYIRNILSVANTTLCCKMAKFVENRANMEIRKRIEYQINEMVKHEMYTFCEKVVVSSLSIPQNDEDNWKLVLIFNFARKSDDSSNNGMGGSMKTTISSAVDFKTYQLSFTMGCESEIKLRINSAAKDKKAPVVSFKLSECIDNDDSKKYSLPWDFSDASFENLFDAALTQILVIKKPPVRIRFSNTEGKQKKADKEEIERDNDDDDVVDDDDE